MPLESRPFLVGKDWRTSTVTTSVRNPFTQAIIAQVCLAGPREAEEATVQAVVAFETMRSMPSHARARALQAIADGVKARQEEFAQTIVAEGGKPILDARREVGRAIQTLILAAEEAKRMPGEVVPLDLTPGMDSYLGMTQRFPIGPVLGITPFNFPINLVMHKVAPCFAVGNPIVIKPAPQTPLTALKLGEVVLESGLPAGAFSVLPCENAVAERLVVDPRYQMLSFTGSAPV